MASRSMIVQILDMMTVFGIEPNDRLIEAWTTALSKYSDDEVLRGATTYVRTGEKKPVPNFIIHEIFDNKKAGRGHDPAVVSAIYQHGKSLDLYDGLIVRLVNIHTGKIPWDGIERHEIDGCKAFLTQHKDDWFYFLRDYDAAEWARVYGANNERLQRRESNGSGPQDSPRLDVPPSIGAILSGGGA